MKTLDEIVAELEAAEKEYSSKCKEYGIEEKKKKKPEAVLVDGNGNPVQIVAQTEVKEETKAA